MADPTGGHVIQAKATRPGTSPWQRHQTNTYTKLHWVPLLRVRSCLTDHQPRLSMYIFYSSKIRPSACCWGTCRDTIILSTCPALMRDSANGTTRHGRLARPARHMPMSKTGKSITSVNILNNVNFCYETPGDDILINSTRIYYFSTCNICLLTFTYIIC